MLAAFRIFDRDHSSSLSADELVHYVSAMPDIGKVRCPYCSDYHNIGASIAPHAALAPQVYIVVQLHKRAASVMRRGGHVCSLTRRMCM